jgi:hypothetical protein
MTGKETLVRAASHTFAAGPRLRRGAALLAFAAVVTGCGGIKPKRAPEGTFDSLRKAIVEENYVALWGLLSADARQSESTRIRAQQQTIYAELPNYSEARKSEFKALNGIAAEEFVNLSPSGVFAMELRYSRKLSRDLRELLEGAKVKAVSAKGGSAVVEVEIPGETETVRLTLEKQNGLWRVPGMGEFLEAFDMAGRARRAGEIPADTHAAAITCLTDNAYGDLWELFAADAQKWLAGIVKDGQAVVAGYDEQQARVFERDAGITAREFTSMPPKDAFVVLISAGSRRLMRIMRVLACEFVTADIKDDKAEVTLRGVRGKLPLERVNGRWYFARMQ